MDSKISRLLLITDKNNDTFNFMAVDNIMRKFQFSPHNIIGVKNATFEYATQSSQKPEFKDLQSTTLILIILSLSKAKRRILKSLSRQDF